MSEPRLAPETLKSRPWYRPTITRVNSDMRRILEDHGIPSAEIENHVVAIRDRAWTVAPYVCLGQFLFADFYTPAHPCFRDILGRLTSRSETQLLDVGCGFAQDFRLLVDRGVKASQLVGLDNHDVFVNLGYDLFRDRSTLGCRFVMADMLDARSIPVDMRHSFDIIWGGASFHLFNWEEQIKAYCVALELLKDQLGVAIYGYQAGHPETKAMPSREVEGKIRYFWHNPASFESMWAEIAEKTRTRWRIRSWNAGTVESLTADMAGTVRQLFAVERVAGPVGVERGVQDEGMPLWTDGFDKGTNMGD